MQDAELIPAGEAQAVADSVASIVSAELTGIRQKLVAAEIPDYAAWLVDAMLQEALTSFKRGLVDDMPIAH